MGMAATEMIESDDIVEREKVTLRVAQGVVRPGEPVVVRWVADPDADEEYDHRSWDFLALYQEGTGPGGEQSPTPLPPTPVNHASRTTNDARVRSGRKLRGEPVHAAPKGGGAAVLRSLETGRVCGLRSARSMRCSAGDEIGA